MMACGANSSAISTRVHDRVIAEHNDCTSDTHTDSSCYSESAGLTYSTRLTAMVPQAYVH